MGCATTLTDLSDSSTQHTRRVHAWLRTDGLTNHLFPECATLSCNFREVFRELDPACQLLPTKFSIINVKLSETKLETLRLLLLAVGSYPRARATRAACMEKIYEIPRATAARVRCASSLPVKDTVLLQYILKFGLACS